MPLCGTGEDLLPQGDIPMSGQGEGAFGAKGGPGFRGEKPEGIFSFEKRMSPLWKPLPGQDGGAAAEREVGDVLFAAPVCGVPTGAGMQCRTEQV